MIQEAFVFLNPLGTELPIADGTVKLLIVM
jgi:hypothetical protein